MNCSTEFSPQKIEETVDSLQTLAKNWISPSFQIQRIVFPGIKNTIDFIQKFAHLFQSNNQIICDVNSAFDLAPLFKVYKDLSLDLDNLQCEFITTDSQEDLDTLKYLLQDKWDEFHIPIAPKCSLLHTSYEIQYSELISKRRKGSKKPPVFFQRYLQKIRSGFYPDTLGKEYYGNKVFSTYINLFLQQIQGKNEQFKDLTVVDMQNKIDELQNLPLPPKPIKFYDFQDSEDSQKNTFNSSVEIRFKSDIPLNELAPIMNFLVKQNEFSMFRIEILYDRWETAMAQKSAGSDRFFFTFNDIDFAFRERNWQLLKSFKHQKSSNNTALYFQLTPLIQDPDFRTDLLSSIFKTELFMR
ncbi:MAG: hypothetical protein ACTSWL_08675 [Promethearchaeota archaeon]